MANKGAVLEEASKEPSFENQLPVDNSDKDFILAYSRSALLLGLMACNFNEARKYGDGGRLLNIYKYLFLLFRLEGRTKKALYTFQLICQVQYLLPEKLAFDLQFNRFTNNKGLIDANVEIDREVEHWNRIFKKDCKGFNGKVTDRSIERASTSYQSMERILSSFNRLADVHHQSGKHCCPSFGKDVLALSKQLQNEELFKQRPGRRHSAYPAFPDNLFKDQQWMPKKIKHFKGLNVYSKLS
eukprot:Seg5264.1 transcript_id=Seg5264.1/GoldUCD/mRNA.D3Y31 product="hypothetical protein" protein_id=Seg5264.1/GoldUCD/D3Y31